MVFVTLFMNVQPVYASTETTISKGYVTEDNTIYVVSNNGSSVTFYYDTYENAVGNISPADGAKNAGYDVNDLLTGNPSVTPRSLTSTTALCNSSQFNSSYKKVEYLNYNTSFTEANMPEPLDYSDAYHKYFGGEGEIVPPASGDDEGTVEGDVNITVVDNTKIERLLNNILAILIFVVIWSMFLYPLAHKMTNNKGLM